MWNFPAAQLGLQSFTCAAPFATAEVAFQRDQMRREIEKLPSLQAMTIVFGRMTAPVSWQP
jgi:hypothetical protein